MSKEKTDWASMKVGLFSDRGTDVSKAIEYAHAIIESDGGKSKAAFYTGLHVVINTIANRIISEQETS